MGLHNLRGRNAYKLGKKILVKDTLMHVFNNSHTNLFWGKQTTFLDKSWEFYSSL